MKTAEELLTPTIEEFMSDLTNSCPVSKDTGSFSVLDHFEEHADDFEPGDVGIYYDYCDDDLNNDDDKDKLTVWLYDEAWPAVRNFMNDLGYVATCDNDGSGNGLYYGYEGFRKVK